jgi:hypothetical protein
MTDTELSQLRQNLMAQFQEMMADDLPTGQHDYASDVQPLEWAPKN